MRHREVILADVFLSYVRSDHHVASEAARVLEAAGLSVWWDHRLRAGADFSAEIEREIAAARAVVVFWSSAAHDSTWVRDEAAYARDRKKLIPVQLDGAEPPLGFRQIQTLSISTLNDAAKVRVLEQLTAAVLGLIDPASRAPATVTVQPAVNHVARRWWPALLVVTGALTWLFANERWLSRESAGQEQTSKEAATAPLAISQKSIAVLPFTDMSEKKDQEFLADGIADEILNLLVKAPDLLVSARTSSFYFKGKPTKIPEIARELGVAHVLEGSIRRAGHQLRVTAQLIRADTGYHLWSETYDRELRDVFAVQDEIANAVTQALQIKLKGGELRRRSGGTQNLDAYELYLRADQEQYVGSQASWESAHAHLDRAIEIDPNYGLAVALLSQVFAWKAENGFIETYEGYARAQELAQRALRLSPDTPFARTTLQVIHKNVDHNWAAWDIEAKRALAIDPTHPDALQIAALLSTTLGRWDEAEGRLRTALARDPLNTYVQWGLGANYYGAGRLREAEEVLRKLLEMAPEFLWTRVYLAKTLLAQDRAAEALAVLQQEADEGYRSCLLPAVLDRLGRGAEADEALEAQLERDADGYCLALTYASRGDHATALQWLERAYDQHHSGLNEILSEPVFRQAPYREFLRKMNLADEAARLVSASPQS